MRVKMLTIVLSFLLILISCQSHRTNISAEPIPEEPMEQNIPFAYLFSNEDKIEEESSYYDALLEFNRVYPGYMKFKKIVTAKEESLVRYYHVDVFPTLLVVYESEEILRIEGFKESEEIFQLIEKKISIEKDIEET